MRINNKHSLSRVLIFLVICWIFAFNDQKLTLYTIKVLFIVAMTFRLFIYRNILTLYMLWGVSFLTVCCASVIWAVNQYEALFNFVWALQVLAITILMGSIIKNIEDINFILKCIIFGAVLLSIRLIIETPMEVWGSNRVGAAIGYNSNDVGLKVAFATICSFYLAKVKNKNYLYLLTCLLSVITLLSGSRKAAFIVILGIVIYYILSINSVSKFAKTIPAIIIFLFGSYQFIMNFDPFYNVIGYRLESMLLTIFGDGHVEGSTFTRIQMASVGLDLIKYKPLFGYGIGNYSIVSGFNTYSHNNFVELLVGVGFFGFIIYYSFYLYLLEKLVRGKLSGNNEFAFPLTIVLVITMIETGLVSYNTGYIQIFLMLCFYWIKCMSAIKISKGRSPIEYT